MYRSSPYKFSFYKAYLRERSLYKTKRNKLYRFFIQISYNRQRPPKFRAGKRGGNRSFHYQLLLKKILYPLFGRRVRTNRFHQYATQRRCIKTQSGRFRSVLNGFETSPAIFATKLGWAPTIEWARHFNRNSWYSVSREEHHASSAHFSPEGRSLAQDLKFPLKQSGLDKYKFEQSIYPNFTPFTRNKAVVHSLNPGDILQISPHIMKLIRSYIRTKPKWNKPVVRGYTDTNTNRFSALVLNSPNVADVRKRDRNNISSLRSLV